MTSEWASDWSSTDLPPRPNPVSGEPRPPAAPRSVSVSRKTPTIPPRKPHPEPPGYGPLEKGTLNQWFAAGAEWLQVKDVWVEIYDLVRISAGTNGADRAIGLEDSGGRSIHAVSLKRIQGHPAMWDLVYNGILHSVASGKCDIPPGARKLLQIPRGVGRQGTPERGARLASVLFGVLAVALGCCSSGMSSRMGWACSSFCWGCSSSGLVRSSRTGMPRFGMRSGGFVGNLYLTCDTGEPTRSRSTRLDRQDSHNTRQLRRRCLSSAS